MQTPEEAADEIMGLAQAKAATLEDDEARGEYWMMLMEQVADA